jgi:hypothetical protein
LLQLCRYLAEHFDSLLHRVYVTSYLALFGLLKLEAIGVNFGKADAFQEAFKRSTV